MGGGRAQQQPFKNWAAFGLNAHVSTMEFVYSTALLVSYVIDNFWWQPRILREELIHEPHLKGIVAYEPRIHYTQPVQYLVGGVILRKGGGVPYTVNHRISCWFTAPQLNTHHIDCWPIKGAGGLERTTSVTTYETLKKVVENTVRGKYSQKFLEKWPPLSGQIKVEHYDFKGGVWLHRATGLLSTDKERLLKEIVSKRRQPLMYVIPAIVTISVALDWFDWSVRATRYSPPAFHWQRLKRIYSGD
jgi:hypothetical protein